VIFVRGVGLLCALALLNGCDVGPPAFDRAADEEASHGPVDTADVATLPDVPTALDVETTGGFAPGEGTTGSAAAESATAASTADGSAAAPPDAAPGGEATATGDTGAGGAPGAAGGDTARTEASRWGSVPGGPVSSRTAAPAGDSLVSLDSARGADGPIVNGQDGSAGARDEPAGADRPDERTAVGSQRFPRPDDIRGLYVNAWAAGSQARMSELLDIADRTEINALVIDIKDASGYVSHRTNIPLAHEIGATGEIRIRDIAALLDKLDSAGVYPIARIVIVKDPLLAEHRPELAAQDTAGGVWADEKGVRWLNPYDTAVWEYHIALAREVAKLGFPEVQWDYVRFPDAPASQLDRAIFHGANGRTKAQAVRDFLAYSRERLAELDVVSTADVFGVTTSAARDVGIGQLWESFIDVVDVALPMVYPSHYWQGSFGLDAPNAYPYEIVRHALTDATRRSGRVDGAGATRPWLQDFTLGEPRYSAPEVRAQIQATYDVGIDEWILWNPGSRYTVNALEPARGFRYEPWVRVGGTIVPVSRRFEAIDAWRVKEAARKAAERAARDSAAARAARDTLATNAILDSLRPAPPVDTSAIERLDSIRAVRELLDTRPDGTIRLDSAANDTIPGR